MFTRTKTNFLWIFVMETFLHIFLPFRTHSEFLKQPFNIFYPGYAMHNPLKRSILSCVLKYAAEEGGVSKQTNWTFFLISG